MLEYDKLIVDHKVYVWNEVKIMMMMMVMLARWRAAW